MSTRLAVLLDAIAPARTLEAVDQRVDKALNTYRYPAGKITEFEAFRGCLAEFHSHVEANVLNLREPLSDGTAFYWERCLHLLMQEYGPSGEKAAFEMARTGTEGGLYRVLKDIARRLSSQYADNEISARINNYWNGLSSAEKLTAADGYLEHFAHLLPSELTEGPAARLRANFPQVLREHPRMMQRLSRIGRT